MSATLGHFDFDDGGTFVGRSEGGKAHGVGVCTGLGGHGSFAGTWQHGFESSGVYTWPNGNEYGGQWSQGKRHGLGVERKGHWVYRGEWTHGLPGRYGVRQSTMSGARYEGTWTSGQQDGYGLETYTDGGTYQGQWMKGQRHGYGVRQSALHRDSALCRQATDRRSSLTSIRSEADVLVESPAAIVAASAAAARERHRQRGGGALGGGSGVGGNEGGQQQPVQRIGFFLKARCVEMTLERRGSFLARQIPSALRNSVTRGLKRQLSSGDVSPTSPTTPDPDDGTTHRSRDDSGLLRGPVAPTKGGPGGMVSIPFHRDTLAVEGGAVEVYTGEWKADKRCGFGVCERSDGLRYEGEWNNNCKNGYGVTTYADGLKEEGKYRNNLLQSSGRRLLTLRASKVRERIDAAVAAATRAAQITLQKSDIANSRMESARSKAELADEALERARLDAEVARRQTLEIQRSEQQQQQARAAQLHKRPTPQDPHMRESSQQHHALVPNHVPHPHHTDPHRTDPHRTDPRHADPHRMDPRHNTDPNQQLRSREPSLPPNHAPRSNPNRWSAGSSSLNRDSRQYDEDFDPRQRRDFATTNHLSYSRPPNGSTGGGGGGGAQGGTSSTHRPQTYDYQRRGNRASLTGSVVSTAETVYYPAFEYPEDDPIGEIDDIFSYLNDEDSYQDSSTGGEDEGGRRSRGEGGLRSRPSLRQRRDVQGLDLVIFDKKQRGGGSSVGKSTTTSSSASNIHRDVYMPQRRLTLPSIMKYRDPALLAGVQVPEPLHLVRRVPKESGARKPPSTARGASASSVKTGPPVAPAEPLPVLPRSSVADMHVFEEGIRKRLEIEEDWAPPPIPPDIDPVEELLEPPKDLPQRYRLGSVQRLTGLGAGGGGGGLGGGMGGKRGDMGSMPDVSAMRGVTGHVMPRGEAHLLSAQKREELRLMREREEQMRRHAIVLKFGDFNDFCSRHQLMLFILLVNAVAAALFYKLLAP